MAGPRDVLKTTLYSRPYHVQINPISRYIAKKTALDEIMEKKEKLEEKFNRKDYWVTEGIVVKVMTKSLGDKYYKTKGEVIEMNDKYAAVVKMLDKGVKLKVDQQHLETVILIGLGKLMKVVNVAYRGEIVKLLSSNDRNYCVNAEIASGILTGRKLNDLEYEDICKLHIEEEEKDERKVDADALM